MKCQPNQTIRRVGHHAPGCTIGKTYVVVSVDEFGNPKIVNDDGVFETYDKSFFELVVSPAVTYEHEGVKYEEVRRVVAGDGLMVYAERVKSAEEILYEECFEALVSTDDQQNSGDIFTNRRTGWQAGFKAAIQHAYNAALSEMDGVSATGNPIKFGA
jgi:hypothetical protein